MTWNRLDGATAEHWAMVEANTGLVWRHVNRLRVAEHDRDDAYQDGLLGLLRAAMLFDESKGFTFSTYADAWIMRAIKRGRGRAMGRNYRRATERGDGWTEERSLNEPAHRQREGETLGDHLPGDADTEHDGVTRVIVHDAQVAILGACGDVIDLEIAESMMVGEVLGGSAIARRHGVTRQAVSARRSRLRRVARQSALGAA